jgi:sec-independent protein translocase protein TatA
MPSIGPLEIAIVMVVALLVFGPRRLPELGRSLGRGIREFGTSVAGKDEVGRDDQPPPEVSAAEAYQETRERARSTQTIDS